MKNIIILSETLNVTKLCDVHM